MNRTSLLLPLLAVLSLASTRASAATLASVCNRFNNQHAITSCFSAARGLPVDEQALDVCNRFNTEHAIITCVGAVAGREYTEEEVGVCNRFNTQDAIISCLKSAGRTARRGGHGRGDACRDLVSRQLQECRRGGRDAASALACLERSLGL